METVLIIEDNNIKILKRRDQKYILTLVFCIGLFMAAGCTSQISSQVKFDRQPYEPIINANTLTLEVVSINNALKSEEMIKKAVNYFKPYVAGEIKIVESTHISLDINKNNEISGKQLEEILNSRNYGPTWITIAISPDIDCMKDKGMYGCAWPPDKPESIRHCIIINMEVCKKASSRIPFVSSQYVASLVLFHELCHALRVPARKEHAKKGDDGHCSDSHCILYPKIDLSSALNALIHMGPPTALCKKCQQEVFAVRKAKIENQSDDVKSVK